MSLQEGYDDLVVEKKEGFAILRLNRPQVLNALSFNLISHIAHALGEVEKDAAVKSCIITGGEKAFSAGADIRDMASRTFSTFETDNDFSVWDAMERFRKPLIAAVEGYALGGGCELAMACDIIVASEGTKFGQPEINLGIMPGAGGTQRLTRSIGRHRAMRYILTGELFSADEADRMGLLSSLVKRGEALNEAVRIAGMIAQKSSVSLLLAKEAVNASQEVGLGQGLRLERQLFYSLFSTEDQKEGMDAFLSKRQPKFTGR
jgi:enoyl-CoA hydratase